jgi:hypothetical protein
VSDEETRTERGATGAEQPRIEERSTVDRSASSFLDLEMELSDLAGGRGRKWGVASDVERVPATAVPADYPLDIPTDDALRIAVVPRADKVPTAGERVSIHVEWPPSDDGPLGRLLELRGIDRSRFADLHGERIPLAVEDGYLVPRLPPRGHPGDARGRYGILLGLAGNLFALGLGSLGPGLRPITAPLVLALVVLNLVVLPAATYLDARHLLTTTDWAQSPLFWATLAAVPGLNVVSSLAYLYTRSQATPL